MRIVSSSLPESAEFHSDRSDKWVPPPLPLPSERDLLTEALAVCTEILDQCPTRSTALHALGLLSARDGRMDLAVEYLRRAFFFAAADGDRIEILRDLADALERRGHQAEAIAARLHLLRLRPADSEQYGSLGKALQGAGRHVEALAMFQEVLKIQPDNLVALAMQGTPLESTGRFTEARMGYQRCLQLRPDDAEMHGRVGRLHLRQREWEFAREAFTNGLRSSGLRSEDRAALLRGLGEVQISLRDYGNALNTLREALFIEPANLEALSRLIFALEVSGLAADAAQAWVRLGVALENRARIPEAISAYQRAIAHQRDCLEARLRIGSLYLLLGDVRSSVRHLEAAVTIARTTTPPT
jgi:tetratricopeptide (TPR) repeat protein